MNDADELEPNLIVDPQVRELLARCYVIARDRAAVLKAQSEFQDQRIEAGDPTLPVDAPQTGQIVDYTTLS